MGCGNLLSGASSNHPLETTVYRPSGYSVSPDDVGMQETKLCFMKIVSRKKIVRPEKWDDSQVGFRG